MAARIATIVVGVTLLVGLVGCGGGGGGGVIAGLDPALVRDWLLIDEEEVALQDTPDSVTTMKVTGNGTVVVTLCIEVGEDEYATEWVSGVGTADETEHTGTVTWTDHSEGFPIEEWEPLHIPIPFTYAIDGARLVMEQTVVLADSVQMTTTWVRLSNTYPATLVGKWFIQEEQDSPEDWDSEKLVLVTMLGNGSGQYEEFWREGEEQQSESGALHWRVSEENHMLLQPEDELVAFEYEYADGILTLGELGGSDTMDLRKRHVPLDPEMVGTWLITFLGPAQEETILVTISAGGNYSATVESQVVESGTISSYYDGWMIVHVTWALDPEDDLEQRYMAYEIDGDDLAFTEWDEGTPYFSEGTRQ